MIFDPYESRRLIGTHAALYRESLRVMADIFHEGVMDEENFDPTWTFGVLMFDELDWRQQMQLLISVSHSALSGVGDPDDWNALEKAAFYAVYRNIYHNLEIERDLYGLDEASIAMTFADPDLDLGEFEEAYEAEDAEEGEDDERTWREMISGAYREKCQNEGLEPEEIEEYLATDEEEGDDLDHWNSILESLADQLLDDRDFEMASTLMDADPEIAAVIKKELGIKPDYFLETASDPDKDSAPRLFRELAALVGRPISGIDDSDAPF